ncbi:hypothetical protein [Sphingomonas sp. BE137]|uniref:hypothetical protein n=1 Tax=Sphingomonas sp. BE137 TaxID=2817844 RepID=UPI001AE0F3D5|nr:hypothetical protein [Sphingomonas sp. BE137]MDR6850374.1 hypothetical protein [Sphingomonas sp. BE137]
MMWRTGLAITLTTIVSFQAFWRLSPGVTFAIGCCALVGLLTAIWIAGEPARDPTLGQRGSRYACPTAEAAREALAEAYDHAELDGTAEMIRRLDWADMPPVYLIAIRAIQTQMKGSQ